ncbi:RING-H2 finger protein ATL18-like [Cucumis melo var. makuwa]|uniref:RING-H2 finger protein ATL18-like n=1 Tax=Cucumis melo var. makuwa TaxID=1194695 RepID=A0A5A7TXY0_CUCMM|nr:RING-H2 finger protein ATL18-like [Cucumis melo var. makuwa]
MLGLFYLVSPMRFPILFFSTFLWIPLFRMKQAILGVVATVFGLPSSPQHGTDLVVVRSYDEDHGGSSEEICSICLTEFGRSEDSVCKLPNCEHLFHFNCIQEWIDRNRFTCPLCRCFFLEDNHKMDTKWRFLVPDNPSSLYYFLQ